MLNSCVILQNKNVHFTNWFNDHSMPYILNKCPPLFRICCSMSSANFTFTAGGSITNCPPSIFKLYSTFSKLSPKWAVWWYCNYSSQYLSQYSLMYLNTVMIHYYFYKENGTGINATALPWLFIHLISPIPLHLLVPYPPVVLDRAFNY